MNLTNLIPQPYRIALMGIAIALLVGAAFAWWSAHNSAQQSIGYNKAAGEYQTKLTAAKDAALITEREWNAKWRKAQNEATEREKDLAIARATAAAADERLRQSASDFRRRLSGATVEACRAAAATAAGLLEECSSEYRSVAAAAAGHASDVRKFDESWPGAGTP